MIHELDQNTINQIAAGEVVERPASVVKELVENSIDAGASAITVEIKEGGTTLIRITDNGSGIMAKEVRTAFLRHATSKISCIEDLESIGSLGFRGEALASISAVAQVELITKVRSDLVGIRYCMDGGTEKELSEIGCPDGTTILIRNLFYNTPARRKFLKSPVTEASYIGDIMERLAISHPGISITLISNGKKLISTVGNGNIKDTIYHIYGRDITANLQEISYTSDHISITGYVCRPAVVRGNRNYENYFVNGRYIRNQIISKAIEEAYKPYMMQHKFPFTVLEFNIPPSLVDVNVHPSKLEVRFSNQQEIYDRIYRQISETIKEKPLIQAISFLNHKEEQDIAAIEKKAMSVLINKTFVAPEPFEETRRKEMGFTEVLSKQVVKKPDEDGNKYQTISGLLASDSTGNQDIMVKETIESGVFASEDIQDYICNNPNKLTAIDEREKFKDQNPQTEQISLFTNDFLTKNAALRHTIIGQLFLTYWLVEYDDQLYIIDQHAAHEKVLFERLMKAHQEGHVPSQRLSPPAIISLSIAEEAAVLRYKDELLEFGYEIEDFGGREYAVSAIPSNLYGLNEQDMLIELIDLLTEEITSMPLQLLHEKIASMSCKAAVKGNNRMSAEEAKNMISELLALDNPFHCPHGRPVIVSMSKQEMERKFKRVL